MRYKPLPEVCDIQYGYAFDSKLFSDNVGTPIVRIRDVVRGYSETKTSELCPDNYNVENGDILIGMDGEFNIAKWNGGHAVLNQRVCKLIPKNQEIESDYLFFYMPKALKAIEDKTPFVTVKHLSAKELNKIIVPIPNRERQITISNQLKLLNTLLGKYNRIDTRLDELIKSRFVEMFGTIHNNVFSYEIKCLQDICEPIKDGTHQTPEYTEDKNSGYIFLSSKDVTSKMIDWTNTKFIPQHLHDELYARIAPRKGDILLAKNGTTGVAAIVDRDVVFDIYVSLALLRPISVNSVYLWAAINSVETKEQFDSSLKGIGVPNLHLGEIKKVKVIVPPIELQNLFADFVTKVEQQKATVQQSIDKLETLKKSLMQEYFG